MHAYKSLTMPAVLLSYLNGSGYRLSDQREAVDDGVNIRMFLKTVRVKS